MSQGSDAKFVSVEEQFIYISEYFYDTTQHSPIFMCFWSDIKKIWHKNHKFAKNRYFLDGLFFQWVFICVYA